MQNKNKQIKNNKKKADKGQGEKGSEELCGYSKWRTALRCIIKMAI